MKIAEIVTQLATVLPLLASRYSDSVAIASISGDGAKATVVTEAPHGLAVDAGIYLTSVAIETPITAVTLTGNTATIETGADHDLTLGWPPHENVTLSGFTDSAWNDSFPLLSVPNRRKFTIDVTGLSAPTLTGSEILHEIVAGAFNGFQQITAVPDATTFEFATTFDGASIGGTVTTSIRVAGAVSGGRAEAEYSKQPDGDLWLFVTQPDSVSLSKDRRALGDAVSEQGANTSFELDIIDGFTIWCFVPATKSKAGLAPSDLARDEVLRDLLLSVQRFKPSSGLANDTPSRIVLRNHGPAVYAGPYYVHQYVFEVPLRMSLADTFDLTTTAAFRDVDMTTQLVDSTRIMASLINLDEEPL